MIRWTVAVAVVGSLACPAFAARWTLDFESKIPDGVRLNGAEVTSERGLVVDGRKSLLADFTADGGEWHQFLEIDAFDFQQGKTYAVRYDYRVVSHTDPKIEFYTVMRSSAAKGDIPSTNWLWQAPTGWTGHINRLFTIPAGGGYTLIIGVRNNGAIAIDNVEISEAMPNEPATRIPVGTHPSQLLRTARRLGTGRDAERINDTLRDMLIIVLNEGAGTKARDKKDQIARDLIIDFVDWNVFGELAQQYGVRSSTGGCEYQEYYRFEGPGNEVEKERTWDNRYKLFGDSGFLVTLENTFLSNAAWGEGGYFTCHNGRAWHRHFLESISEVAQKYLAVTQDNIACSTFNRVEGCYCPGCQKTFNTFARRRFSDQQLEAMGIRSLRDFSIQDYIVDHGLRGDAAVADALVREYMKFQYTTGLEAWGEAVSRCKMIAGRQGRPLPCGGNQINVWGAWPYAVMISQFCDFVEVEELVGIKNTMTRRPMQYKLGLASGHHRKPVWVRGPVVDDTQPEMPLLSTSYWQVHFSEALANGGIREFSLGINKPWTGKPDTKDYMDDPELYQLYVDYAKWMREHRSLLTRRESMARVAIVYSLPTFMFCQYNMLGCGDDGRLPAFENTAGSLERLHVPHDVIVLGHPELWDDSESFDRLRSRYDLIVLPRVDAMTDEQINVLNTLAANNVVLLADTEVVFDENRNRRPMPIRLRADALTATSLSQYGERARQVEVDAPDTVSVNLWQSCEGRSIDVHLVNYDVDIQGEKVRPAENIRVRVALPVRFNLRRCVLSRFGEEDVELQFTRNGDMVETTVPSMDGYAIVSFTDDRSIELAREAAEQRRAADREQVMALARRLNLY